MLVEMQQAKRPNWSIYTQLIAHPKTSKKCAKTKDMLKELGHEPKERWAKPL
jgi:hypothetical protein